MIFPTLKGAIVRKIDLNKLGVDWMKRRCGGSQHKSPFLEPERAERALVIYQGSLGMKWSYGGYFEDRSGIWWGSYLDRDEKYLHLGVDFNAPVGTPVALDLQGEVVWIATDLSDGGWGTYVMFKLATRSLVLLYAHLAPDVLCKVGDVVKAGTVFARVGTSEQNGGWFPHVHVQALTPEAYREFQEDPKVLDGYGNVRDREMLKKKYPDPTPFVHIS